MRILLYAIAVWFMLAQPAYAGLVKQSTSAKNFMFFMADSVDHTTGKTGLSPTVTISKNGGAFAAPAGAITEVGNGWYRLAGNATDSNTLGDLILRATAAGADTSDVYAGDVVAFDPQSASNLGLTNLDATVSSRATPTNITAATGIVLSGVTHTGAVIPTVTTLTNSARLTGSIYGNTVIDQVVTVGASMNGPAGIVVCTSAPTARVYEQETGTVMRNLTLVERDAANTDGFYTLNETLSAANGYEELKGYTVLFQCPYGGNTYQDLRSFAVIPGTVTLAAVTHTGAVIPTVTTTTNITNHTDSSGTTTLLARIPGTVQAQTGDSFARLGAPAGASVSADIGTKMATYTQPTGFLAATFPGTVASPTNITGGTITTATNLTNAPTAGDLTATMKTSVNTEVTTALAAVNLDHLVGTATGIPAIVAGTYLDQITRTAAGTFDRSTDSLEAIRDNQGAGGLTSQQTRDAMKLAPTGGAPAAGSVDEHLDDILTDTGTTLDGKLPAALVGGRMSSDMVALSGDTVAADNAESFFDGTGYSDVDNRVGIVNTPGAIPDNAFSYVGTVVDDSGGATLDLSAGVDFDDQFNGKYSIRVYNTSTGAFKAASCIVDSVAATDIVVTVESIAALIVNGDSFVFAPDTACSAIDIWNVVDLSNEGGNQNPTTTSFDTDLTYAADFTATTPRPIIQFPTVTEDVRQNANCNLQGLRTQVTAYNVTTKVVSVVALPAAPDYRCLFKVY